MQSHFVCGECGYTSKNPGTCQNDICIRQGTRLVECHCDDGKHALIMRPTKDEITQDENEQLEEAKKNDYATNTLDLDNPTDEN